MLKNARKKLGISQKELADKLKVNQSYISKIENYKTIHIPLYLLIDISKELNLDPVDVFIDFLKHHYNYESDDVMTS